MTLPLKTGEKAERYVAENWGYCDADELFEAEDEED